MSTMIPFLTHLFTLLFVITFPFFLHFSAGEDSPFPIVVNTWAFVEANKNAFHSLQNGLQALDAVEAGCQSCQFTQCDGTVGYGGSPDEKAETTLDAMIMDGRTMNVGAVGALRNIKDAISVARHVLERTQHSLLVGSQATRFAKQMGFTEESLATNKSKTIWKDWRHNKCQPNFWTNVQPDPRKRCGPYKPFDRTLKKVENLQRPNIDSKNHDTIGIVAIDAHRDIAVATSTNGASHKIPGRVGDSPIVGAGAYAENGIGGAAATGDGDILMRFLPSFKAIESLRLGLSANDSAENALVNIIKYYPKFQGGVVVVDALGNFGAACHGIDQFPFSVSQNGKYFGQIFHVTCINNNLDSPSPPKNSIQSQPSEHL